MFSKIARLPFPRHVSPLAFYALLPLSMPLRSSSAAFLLLPPVPPPLNGPFNLRWSHAGQCQLLPLPRLLPLIPIPFLSFQSNFGLAFCGQHLAGIKAHLGMGHVELVEPLSDNLLKMGGHILQFNREKKN